MRSALIRDSVFWVAAQGDNALINTEETAERFTLSDTMQYLWKAKESINVFPQVFNDFAGLLTIVMCALHGTVVSLSFFPLTFVCLLWFGFETLCIVTNAIQVQLKWVMVCYCPPQMLVKQMLTETSISQLWAPLLIARSPYKVHVDM